MRTQIQATQEAGLIKKKAFNKEKALPEQGIQNWRKRQTQKLSRNNLEMDKKRKQEEPDGPERNSRKDKIKKIIIKG